MLHRLGRLAVRAAQPEAGVAGDVELAVSLILDSDHDEVASVAFPYFGNREHDHFEGTDHDSVLIRSVPAKKVNLAEGDALVATVFDLFVANYGLDRGLKDRNCAKSFDDDLPYTPAWAEKITGVPREQIIEVGPMSGLSNIKHWLARNGYDADDAELCDRIFQAAKRTDRTLTRDDLERLCRNV